jgi:hypothetical protein
LIEPGLNWPEQGFLAMVYRQGAGFGKGRARYAFLRDAGEWKVDDIEGTSNGEPWSIRQMLAESLKK